MHRFALRHKPSGQFIPEPTTSTGRGGSHVEPGPGWPKLFKTEGAVKGYLTVWLKGKQTRSYGYDMHTGDDWEHVNLEPIPSRKREEMEIVVFELKEVQ